MVLLSITLMLCNSYSYIVLIVTAFLALELSVCGLYYIWILSCLYVTCFVESVKPFNAFYNAYPSYLLVHIIHANPSYVLVHILYMPILLIYISSYHIS